MPISDYAKSLQVGYLDNNNCVKRIMAAPVDAAIIVLLDRIATSLELLCERAKK